MPDDVVDGHVLSDPELITKVRAGDRQAFGELYRRHAGPATTLARQFARSAPEADDLVSESFARVLDNLLDGKGPDTAFRAYLFTSIRNTAYDRTRKDKRLQFTEDMTAHDTAVPGVDPVLAKMETGLIATAFAQLPERWQAVLWHTQVEGESPAQVGALLGMAPGAVSSLAFRAREGLREAYLQAHLADTAAEECRTTVERLGAYTRGGLSKRETAQVDAHLRTCDRCRALAAELGEVNSNLRGLLAPLVLGTAAAGYLATLGPVAPLTAAGTAVAAGAGGSTGAGGASGGAAGGAAGGGTSAGAAAGAAVVGAGAVGAAAVAATAASASGAGSSASGAGGAAGAAGAAGGAAAGGTSGIAAFFGSLGVGAWVAAGAVAVAALVTAVVVVANSGSSDAPTEAAGQQSIVTAQSENPASGDGTASGDGSGTGTGDEQAGTQPGDDQQATTGDADAGAADTAPGDDIFSDPGADFFDNTGDTQGDGGDTDTGTGNGAGDAQPNAPPVIPPAVVPTAPAPSTAPPEPTAAPTGPAIEPTQTTQPIEPTVPPTPPAFSASNLAAGGPLVAGGTGTITLALANTGGTAGTPTDPLQVTTPPGVSVSGVDVGDPVAALRSRGFAFAADAVECTPTPTGCSIAVGEIPAASQVQVTMTVAVAKTGSVGPFFEVAIAGQILQIPIEIAALPADLTLSGITDVDSPAAGESGRYRLTVTNDGGQRSAQANVDAAISTEGAFVQSIAIDGRLCEEGCDVPELDPGDDATIEVVVGIPPGGADGTLTVTVGDEEAGTAIDVPGIPANVVLGDIEQVQPPVAGGSAGIYRVTASNIGGARSDALTLEVEAPTGVTVLSRTINGQPCSPAAPCEVPELEVEGSVVIEVAIDVPITGATGELTINAGTEASSSYSLNVAAAPADLDITIEPVGVPAAGTVATYRVAIENVGGTASAAQPVELAFPASGVTSVGLFVDGDPCGGPNGCETSVEPGATATYDWIIEFDATGATGTLQVRVGDAVGTLQIAVAALPAELTATTFAVVDAPTAGGTGQLLLTLRNDGGIDSAEQSLEIDPPEGASITSYDVGESRCTPGDVPCRIRAIAPGESIDILVNIAVDVRGASGSFEVLSPAVTNGSLALEVPGAPADLEVSQISLIDRPTAGGSGTYQLTVTNIGGQPSAPVTVTADPPPGAAVTSIVIDGESCSPTQQICTLGPLDAQSDPVQIQAILSIATTGVPRDTLTVTVGGQERTTIVFVGGTDADLSFGPFTVTDPPEAGGIGGFAVTVTNTGGSPSQPREVTASAPLGATVTSLTINDRPCAGQVCTLPALPPGGSATLGVTISIPITGATGDVIISVGDESASTAIDVNGTEPDVVLDGPTEIAAAAAGGTGEFRVTATNEGGEASEPLDISVIRPGLVQLRSITVNGVACPAAGPCATPALANAATADIRVVVGIPITGAAGRLTVTVGGSSVFTDLDVDAAPAALVIDPLEPVRQPTLDTSGVYELSVINAGGLASLGLPVTAVVPDGALVTSLSVDARECGEDCVLPELPSGARARVRLEVSVTALGATGEVAVLVGDTPRTTGIDVEGAPAELDVPAELRVVDAPVAGGQGRFEVSVANVGGQPSAREQISITVPDGVAVTAVTAGGEECVPGEQACSLPEIDPLRTSDVSIDVDVLPTGAGGEVLVGIAGQTAATKIAVAPTPADLVVSDLTEVQAPTAGGTGQFQLTVTNAGGAESEPQLVTVDALPKGTRLVGLQVGDTACPDAEKCFLPALPGTADPNEPLIVPITVSLAVDPGGAAGELEVTVGTTTRTLSVTVDAADVTLIATGKEPLRAGSSSTWALTPSTRTPDPWPITLPLETDGIAIADYPETCGPVDAKVPSIACKGPTIDPLTFTVLPTRPAGPAQLAGTANDGRVVDIVGADGKSLPVEGLPVGAPVEFTGQYGGTIVGAETMRCRGQFFVRWLCASPILGPGMAAVDSGADIPRPEGSTVVYAELTWAATSPSSPGSLDTIATSLSAQPITGVAPAGAPNTSGQLVVRTADVTKLLGDARSIQIKPLAASTTITGAGVDVNTAPMAAWTLTVVWSDPKAPVATVSARTGGQPSTSGSTVDVDAAVGSGAPVSVDAAFYATDPWGTKILSASSGRVLSRSLWGAPGNATSGFDLVSVDATDGPLGSPGDAIRLTNQPGSLIFGFQVPEPIVLPGDSLWVGPSLVARVEQAPPA